MIICAPSLDEKPWPTLGPQVCKFIEQNLIFGPGDLRGQPARLSEEKRGLIYRMYEVYPAGDPRAGRRRFKRCALSLRKGVAKTELAAWIAACELHPSAPVRCDGFRGKQPIGRPVNDPYIPMVAYTEEQSEDLAYYALMVILQEGPLAEDFDIGWERIMRRSGDGKAAALAGAPDARDGARTTFSVADETHRWNLPRLKMAHKVMLANLPKRPLADPWAFEITTAPAPGEDSVAEDTMAYGEAVAAGRIKDPRLFFFHRQASDIHDLATPEGRHAALIEASGSDAEWSDIEGILEQWNDPTTDKAYLERVWLNRKVQGSDRAFDLLKWQELAIDGATIADGRLITLGFDGSHYDDATALVVTDVETGLTSLIGLWEKPFGAVEWSVPETDVDAVVAAAFEKWEVWRMYADPWKWESWVALWKGRYGEQCVVGWLTNRLNQMAQAVHGFATAVLEGTISHDGNVDLTRHVGNACRKLLNLRDGEGQRLWVIYKERPDSPNKIDAAMAAVLSRQARTDAIAAGATSHKQVWTSVG